MYFFVWGTDATVNLTGTDSPNANGVTDAQRRTLKDYRSGGRLSTRVKILNDAPTSSIKKHVYKINTPECPMDCGPTDPPSMICE